MTEQVESVDRILKTRQALPQMLHQGLLVIAEEVGRKSNQQHKLRTLSSDYSSTSGAEIHRFSLIKASNICTNPKILQLLWNGKQPSLRILIDISRFKRLSVDERVNSLSTICPHLTDIFMKMYLKQDK